MLSTKGGVVVIVVLAAFIGSTLTVNVNAGDGGECEAVRTLEQSTCTGCTTSVNFLCDSLGESCLGCSYSFTASLSCPPITQFWAGNEDIDCSDDFFYRIGGCGSGPPPLGGWAALQCECEDCPGG